MFRNIVEFRIYVKILPRSIATAGHGKAPIC